jgi:hypothetical protein
MLFNLFIRFVNNKVNKSKKQIRLTEFIHILPDREAQQRKNFYRKSHFRAGEVQSSGIGYIRHVFDVQSNGKKRRSPFLILTLSQKIYSLKN